MTSPNSPDLQRRQQLDVWLKQQFPGRRINVATASADASFRRYFRITDEGGVTSIVMDAPPSHEDCRTWLKVRALLGDAGLAVPQVLAEDLEQGFLLISDLGDSTYLSALDAASATPLYTAACDSLLKMQRASRPGLLPPYDRELLLRELNLFPDWFLKTHHGIEFTEAERNLMTLVFERILASNLAEPQVFVHRDYHSRNLMLNRSNPHGEPGVIDFQDAVYGPITYDLVSLFKDAYVEWDEEQVLDWLVRYWEKARAAGLPVRASFADFHRDYEWMGAQRHIKVLGIFARLYRRDGKSGYLKDIPRVARYLRRTCERYDGLKPLLRLLDKAEQNQPQVAYTF